MYLVEKNTSARAGDLRDMDSIPGFRKIPWKKAWQPTLVFLPGERSLTSYSPYGCTESDMTEVN